jgi:SAM-dependent methyltransferase
MGQVTGGLRAILSNAHVYDLVQNVLGVQGYRREITRAYLSRRPAPLRILDVGCGTAEILEQLPECTYVGVDMSSEYIEAARRRYAGRGTFLCASVADAAFRRWHGQFDVVLMLGLLHHLDDHEVPLLFRDVAPGLAADGVVVSVDPTVAPETHPFGRWLASRDRGRNVRPPAGYVALAGQAFHEVSLTVRHDLLRVPYSHAILECSRPVF